MTRQVRNFALRLIVMVAILLTLGRIYGAVLVAPILPAISWVIEATESGFYVDRIYVTSKQHNTVIQLKVIPKQPMIIGARVLMPKTNLYFEPSILVGSILQPLILLLAILIAWPTKSMLFFPMRLLLCVPAILVLFTFNAPLGLVGAMWDYREYFPDMEVHLLVYWNDFLQTGGPLVMAIVAGVLVVSAADYWTKSLSSKLLAMQAKMN
jgi:hypothetical protein